VSALILGRWLTRDNGMQMSSICYNLIQMGELVETAELLAFSKTVEAKSLSRAAAELGVPRATLSRRLARLEERLGTRLLRRSTRSLRLTDSGESLYRHARIVLDAVANAEASVRQTDQAVRGDLRVSVPPIAEVPFLDFLCAFAERFPLVRLQVHSASEVVDLRREGYDVAIRAGSEIEPGLMSRTLMRETLLAVASPAYLESHGMPRSRRDLRKHRCLMGFTKGTLPQSHWPVAGGKLRVEGAIFSNDVGLLARAALRGQGIALLPMTLVHQHIDSGALVPVLPSILNARARLAVVYLEREFLPPPVRAFVDAAVVWAAEFLEPRVPAACKEAAGLLGEAPAPKPRRR
jgi:DNA-binding transcriptional LysR family regulator